MDDDDKLEIQVKIMFLIDVILLVLILFMAFKLVESNNETTAWLLEHGRIK